MIDYKHLLDPNWHEPINRETAIDNITTGLCSDIACAECPFNDVNDMCKVREWLKQLPRA